jgi:hypothetical protein
VEGRSDPRVEPAHIAIPGAMERRSIIRITTEIRGRMKGKAARYTATVYDVLCLHLMPLLLCLCLIDPGWLIPMLRWYLPKMHGPRSKIRQATVGVPDGGRQSD